MKPGDLRISLTVWPPSGKPRVCNLDLHGVNTITARGLRKLLRGFVSAILAEFKP